MSPNNDFDVGPLTWVKSEIDAALDKAREALEQALAGAEKQEPLRFAQNHVHQASGALSVVGLDGVSQFADAIDKLLARLSGGEGVASGEAVQTALRGISTLSNYLNELLAGAPHQPLRLYPLYAEIVSTSGGDTPQPSELFFPDLSVRPALGEAPAVEAERARQELRVLRSRFEKGLLAWIRQPMDQAGPLEMLKAVRRISQSQALPATRAFWWSAIAFFEGLAQQSIMPDKQAHRLCRRIDTQMRRLIEGSQVVAERLVRDVLYFVATAGVDTPHAQQVRRVYRLDAALPAPDTELSDTLRQPLALRLRETLESAKEMWNRFCAGAAVALPQFHEQFTELVSRAAALRMPQVDRLLSTMSEVVGWLRADPVRHTEALAMEIATGLLVVEQATDLTVVADPGLLRKQVDLLCGRYMDRVKGKSLPPLDDTIFGEASRRAQDRLFFNQLAREILTNLGQIEQTLDAFFRAPEGQREGLSTLAGPLKQIEGAFAMLGEQAAVQLVRDSAQEVKSFAEAAETPDIETCSEVARKLSALGFYVEAMKNGPTRLEYFLDPESAKAADEAVAAASGTVEAQLARETRTTQSLAQALKETPQDDTLRDQLVSNLEAIREDAQLVADAKLEQQAKDALASLKSGEGAAEIGEALAAVASPAAPQPSEEAARLMSVSREELDAELLSIFMEEAGDVLATQDEMRERLGAEPHDQEALVTIRRGFHTLKGSSRMVGLQEFSEAARHVEMAMNRWLQLEKDGSGAILSLIDAGRALFTRWREQIESGGALGYDASALIAQAQDLLASLDAPFEAAPPAGEAGPPGKAQAPAEAPVEAAQRGESEAIIDFDLSADLPGAADTFEASLDETRFDLDPMLLPGLGSEHYVNEPSAAAPADASRGAADTIDLEIDEDAAEDRQAAMAATELYLPQTSYAPAPQDAPPTSGEGAPILDLTGTLTEAELGRLGVEEHQEVDLSATSFELDATNLDSLMSGSMADAAGEPEEPGLDEDLQEEDIRLETTEEELVTTDLGFVDGIAALEAHAAPDVALDVAPLAGSAAQELPDGSVEIELPDAVFDGLFNAAADEASGVPEELVVEAAAGESGLAEDEASGAGLATEAEPEAQPEAQPEFEEPGAGEAEVVPSPDAEARIPVAASPALHRDEGMEIVAIDEDTESDFALPRINFAALPGAEGDLDKVAPEPEPEVPQAVAAVDPEVGIGDQRLSRGLYDLYMAEARQHMASLAAEQAQLDSNPLRVPSTEAIRAAHTMAGISGTARVEPAQLLARALEHALQRFHEMDMAPDGSQTAVMGAAIRTLDAMVSEVARQQMPLAAPEMLAQLDGVRPVPRAPEPESTADASDEVVTGLVPADEVPVFSDVDVLPGDDDAEEDEEVTGIQDELDEQLLPIFFEEADELSEELGGTLRALRADPADVAAHQAIARLLHTLKGSARMAGAMRLGEYVHGLETRFLSMPADLSMVESMELAVDHVGAMLAALRNPGAAVPPEPVAPSASAGVADRPAAVDEQVPAAASAGPAGGRAEPAAALQKDKPAAVPEDEPEPLQNTRATLRVRADLVDRFVNEAGEISISRTRVEGEMRTLRRSLLDLTENVIRLRNQLREIEIQAESQMQSRIAAAEAHHSEFDPLEFDRFTRLQEVTRMMAESVGDVTTIQQNLLRNLDGADFALHAQARLSRDLQQALMGVRMVPFNDVADRLHRVVRQAAKELGKRANLDIRGGAIEIDRGVLDKMIAPLEHLLRNAVAHGIEAPADRVAAGKAEYGQITLNLKQTSNEIALEMADDGRGLNFERILKRGREAGLVAADEQPTENRLTQLIFEPGFSTAEQVSGVAGRGVGMDVVKNETLAVGGRIDVSSEPGQGARFLVHLPLTLAVTQALLVRASGRTYAIPSNMVEQALELKEPQLAAVTQQGYAEWKGQQYPLRYLPRLLGDMHAQPAQSRFHWILLLRAGNQTVALHIDELRGNQEIIVKNAGPQFVRLQGFTGATVLPDGEIALILNPVVLSGRAAAAEYAGEGAALQQHSQASDYVPLVMVVDDSLTVRKITSRLLEREGFRVVTAKDGVDALEQLVETIPDVMLLDIEMPRMDGFDLARNVRADERLRELPMIMITSRMAEKHRNYAAEIGVNHYLGKPFQEDVLLELIRGFVSATHA